MNTPKATASSPLVERLPPDWTSGAATVVTCPGCAFSFAAEHRDESGSYSCPVCRLAAVEALVSEQAEDEGLWVEAETAAEAYLQRALRALHRAVEHGEPLPGDAHGGP